MRGRGTAHAIDHFLGEFEEGGEGFGVAAEDVAKVGVEEVAFWFLKVSLVGFGGMGLEGL